MFDPTHKCNFKTSDMYNGVYKFQTIDFLSNNTLNLNSLFLNM